MSTSGYQGQDPLAYMGINQPSQPFFLQQPRAPTAGDWQSFNPGDQWLDVSVYPPNMYLCVSVEANVGVWRLITGSSPIEGVQKLTASSGSNPVLPDLTGNINILAGAGVQTVASANTITISSTSGSGDVETLEGNTGGLIDPTSPGGNISILGQGNITINGVPSTHQLDVSLTGITNHAALVGGAFNTINNKVLTNGQVLIGSTGLDPVPATLTAGSNITITNRASFLF